MTKSVAVGDAREPSKKSLLFFLFFFFVGKFCKFSASFRRDGV